MSTSPDFLPTAVPLVSTRLRALIPTIGMILIVAVCITAGNWQRSRMHEKQTLRAQLDAAIGAPAIALPSGAMDWNSLRFRPVNLAGSFIAQRQFLLDNKVHRGKVGFEVITPFKLDDARVVLVNRGFVAGGATRSDLPRVPVPAGEVNVQGRIAIPARGYFELGPDDNAQVQQHLDPSRYAATTGIAVLPIVIEATAPTGADDALLREWPEPDTGVAMHRGYMVQWYTFAALALGLWLWFTFRRRRAP